MKCILSTDNSRSKGNRLMKHIRLYMMKHRCFWTCQATWGTMYHGTYILYHHISTNLGPVMMAIIWSKCGCIYYNFAVHVSTTTKIASMLLAHRVRLYASTKGK